VRWMCATGEKKARPGGRAASRPAAMPDGEPLRLPVHALVASARQAVEMMHVMVVADDRHERQPNGDRSIGQRCGAQCARIAKRRAAAHAPNCIRPSL